MWTLSQLYNSLEGPWPPNTLASSSVARESSPPIPRLAYHPEALENSARIGIQGGTGHDFRVGECYDWSWAFRDYPSSPQQDTTNVHLSVFPWKADRHLDAEIAEIQDHMPLGTAWWHKQKAWAINMTRDWFTYRLHIMEHNG